MKIIIIFVATILYVMLFTRTAFASDIQIFLPIISNQSLHELEEGFNYMAEVPHANSPLSATIQIDVFDKCGACGWEHRLAGIYVEIVYVQGNTTLSTTLQTDWEGVVRFDQRYDQATIRIMKDANGNPVTSSTVNVFYRDPSNSASVVERWGVVFKRSW